MIRYLYLIAILLSATSVGYGQARNTMAIKVHFHNEKLNPNQEDCRKVFPAVRNIKKTRAVARAALDELFRGTTPEERSNQFWAFPSADTKGILKNVNVRNGTAYVNFTKAVYERLGNATTSCGGGFFSMIEQTLLQFPTIKKVFYAIEGSPRDFYEWVQVGECPTELKNCSGKDFR
jgi:spore germination protein GerM